MKKDFDKAIVIQEALKELPSSARRLFMKRAVTLGGLSLLSGCAVTDKDSAERMLRKISTLNDDFQAWLFDPNKLAPTYPESMITRPVPFNAFYDRDEIPEIDESDFLLEVSGLVADKHSWPLQELYQLPQTDQVTRHICVEGWSAIGKWGGVTFSTFLKRIGADLTAKYVGFKCEDDYYTSIDMPTALHAQTLLAFTYDGRILPPEYGYPMKLRMPTKLGYKNPKHIAAIFVTNTNPGGYWEDKGYNWFGGI
ncbi:MAG: molybdopterin-dependent oxidoreductase [Nitrosomonadales bacterium]|nr:molybdopterin-dependent oxidoreductase [Nitrosomonadales bacterium]